MRNLRIATGAFVSVVTMASVLVLVVVGCRGTADDAAAPEASASPHLSRCMIDIRAAEDDRVVRLDLRQGDEGVVVSAFEALTLEVEVVSPYAPIDGTQVLPDGTPVPSGFRPPTMEEEGSR